MNGVIDQKSVFFSTRLNSIKKDLSIAISLYKKEKKLSNIILRFNMLFLEFLYRLFARLYLCNKQPCSFSVHKNS